MKKQWWQEEVVYQLYPRSFADSNADGIGDLKGIIKKMDYLKQLGITMIWLSPIFKSPMDDNGYDISDYLAIADEFGTMQDLKELIDVAKQKGMKIILDLVLNHTSDEHPWFIDAINHKDSIYRDYYIFKEANVVPNNWRSIFGGSVWEKVPNREEYYFHSFGKKQPDLNWENPNLRKALYHIIETWATMGITGFRVDAITFIKKDQRFESLQSDGSDGLVKCTKTTRNQDGIEAFLHEMKEETFKKYDCMSVAEAAGLRYEQLERFIGDDGYFSMVFDFKHADLDIASGCEWFKRIPWTIKDLRTRILDSQLNVQKYGWAANFIENHDQPRATSKYLREYEKNSDAVKMLGAMYFFLRGTPFIYQGQELGMVNFERKDVSEFNDLSSIDQYQRSLEEGFSKEEALHFVNLRSRDNARTPFPWDASIYGGFSTNSPWLKMDDHYEHINVAAQIDKEDSVLRFYQNMIQFRQHSEFKNCLIYGSISSLEVDHDNVIAYRREYEGEVIDCYYNFSNDRIDIPTNKQYAVLFSNMKEETYTNDIITLKPFQAILVKGM